MYIYKTYRTIKKTDGEKVTLENYFTSLKKAKRFVRNEFPDAEFRQANATNLTFIRNSYAFGEDRDEYPNDWFSVNFYMIERIEPK